MHQHINILKSVYWPANDNLDPLKMEMYVSSISKRNATKTDLSLLLECLKYQMKCPASQKQALFTIYSICQQREENVDFFREMGGVVFVYNLSKSSAHSEVRETAQFTLGMLAEANVYCKQALCRRETFSDLAECLMQQDSPLTQRRVAVYLLSVLVANNRSGQKFAQTSGCLDILLDLFRTSFPLSGEATVRPANVTQLFQLWTSVSSALCGCVNNPQNEESQRMCVSAFPLVKGWLQQLSHPYAEMVQPICSFISMTVANNHCAQDSFSIVGGLENLTLTLIRLASDASHSPLACQLSVIMTKTLSACIIDNPVLASGLAGYGLVPQLHSLLSSRSLEPQDRLIVILTLGHCTEASEEHRSQFLQCGGLSLITLLTESTSEELRKAAAFILQTCKQATVFLRGAVHGESQGQTAELEPPVDMEGYWRSARDMLHRINQLERQQAQKRVRRQTSEEPQKLSRSRESEREKRTHTQRHTTLHMYTLGNTQPEKDRGLAAKRNTYPLYTNTLTEKCTNTASHIQTENGRDKHLGMREQAHTPSVSAVGYAGPCRASVPGQPRDGEDERCSVYLGTGTLVPSSSSPLEGHSQTHTHSQVFKCPAPGKPGMSRQKKPLDDEGCVFGLVTSRSFPVLQRNCPHSCDLHLVLQQATHSYTQHLRDIRRRREIHTTGQRETRRGTQSVWDHCRDKIPEVLNTPTHRCDLNSDMCPVVTEASLTPVCKETLLRSFSTNSGQRNTDHNHVSLTPLETCGPCEGIAWNPLHKGLMKSLSSVTSRGQERGDRREDGVMDEEDGVMDEEDGVMDEEDGVMGGVDGVIGGEDGVIGGEDGVMHEEDGVIDNQQKTLSMGNPSLTQSSSKTKEKRVNTNEVCLCFVSCPLSVSLSYCSLPCILLHSLYIDPPHPSQFNFSLRGFIGNMFILPKQVKWIINKSEIKNEQ
ncbi:telomere repeats-binding bouquet formation protein 1-like isoform X6 [Oncorhynchus keta]|uniref:telomere repeats-binding bouquet formation protein 1-like isoform X6 n=1 Tax=Oncorhynchus keta TaxID=8018 RepID=UPI00227B43AE|nr:telomere repeats-binding bouquet formation protein 1-like isoform X6 [Oncorhynchus keta]